MMPLEKQKLVWVDTDIAIGHKSGLIKYCDVDDGYALTALLRSAQVDVIGISSTLGNVDDIEISTNIARHFIATYGPNSVPVYQGADHPLPKEGTPAESNQAVENLAATLKDNRLTILAIGAATNIAMLLLKYPALQDQISEIVLVAGRSDIHQHFYSGHRQPKPFRDLNFDFDPRAFEVLFQSKVPITLVPFETCHKMWLKTEDLIAIGKANKVGRYLAEHSAVWMAEWMAIFGAEGFNPFDLVAAGYIIHPEYFTWRKWHVSIEEGPDDTKAGHTKPYLICNEDIVTGPMVRYCVDVSDACKPFLMDRIGSHDMSAFILGLSHINVVVPCVDEATAFYNRVLGFQQAYGPDKEKMDYTAVTMASFALDAGIMDGKVNVDVRFLKHPQANIYLELMAYHTPKGKADIPKQPKTFDMGGPRHVAMEVSNCNEVFNYINNQDGVTMINTNKDYHPTKLDGFPITFFYWVDQYGIQWEMEEGRRVGTSRGIV